MKTQSNTEWTEQYESYLKRRFPDRSTAKHYVSDLRIFMKHYTGPLTEVTTQDVDRFVDQQRAAGLSPATVKRRAAALKTFYDFVAEELHDPGRDNPVSMRRHAGRQPQKLPRDLKDEEVQCVLAVIESERDMAMVSLMLYAGLRVGEVVCLRTVDITVPEDAQAPVRLRVLGKGRKERVTYLHRAGYAPVAQYLVTQSGTDAASPLFRNRFGDPIGVGGVQARMTHYAALSGVEVTCHRLRHTYGRWMVEGEMPVLTLSRLMGHASIQTTQGYIDGADPQVRRSYEAAMERSREQPRPAAVKISRPLVTPEKDTATVVRELPPTFTGEDWMPDWPAWLRAGCVAWVQQQWYQWKPSQRHNHARVRLYELRQFWNWQLTQREWRDWEELSTADISAFVDAQLSGKLTAGTVNRILNTLYALLRYLHRQQRLTHIPHRPKIALPDSLPKHLMPAEVLALETFVSQQQQQQQAPAHVVHLDIALYYLLAHAGLRICEALDLQVQDLDLANQRIRINCGKWGHDRVVFLTTDAAQALSAYLQTVPHAAHDLVLSKQGRPLRYHEAYYSLRHLGEAAGVSQLGPLRLRHTYATLLLNNGVPLESLRRLMGHKNLSTTLIYARMADETMEQQYQVAMEIVTNSVNSM
jgi:site-specific recombinase XerD